MDNEKEGLVPIRKYEDLLDAIKKRKDELGKTTYRVSKDAGLYEPSVHRMLKGETEAKLSSILETCKVLGIEVFVRIK